MNPKPFRRLLPVAAAFAIGGGTVAGLGMMQPMDDAQEAPAQQTPPPEPQFSSEQLDEMQNMSVPLSPEAAQARVDELSAIIPQATQQLRQVRQQFGDQNPQVQQLAGQVQDVIEAYEEAQQALEKAEAESAEMGNRESRMMSEMFSGEIDLYLDGGSSGLIKMQSTPGLKFVGTREIGEELFLVLQSDRGMSLIRADKLAMITPQAPQQEREMDDAMEDAAEEMSE